MATEDTLGRQIQATRACLTMYNNTREAPIGKVTLYVERKSQKHKVHFYVKSTVVPILGKESCVQMGLVKILDCDNVINVKDTSILDDPVLTKFSDVFEGLGELPGEYMLHINPDIALVVHPPRKLRKIVKSELEVMTTKGIIVLVTEPTKWVSSMVVVQKKNGKLDPRNLNQAIMRSHYPLPTIEEVATRLTGAKVFTVLDAKTGLWQVKLHDPSSYLTTFNTPFGRYRWKRIPFGINSAPEVW